MKQIVSYLFILDEFININYIFRQIFIKFFTMNSTNANIINSVCLIVIGLWGYFEVSSPTALIPVGFGAVLILCTPGVKKQNKVIAHVAVLLTLVILVALAGMRLPKSIEKGGLGLVRVFLMIGTSALSMVYFIGSFIAARKAREKS
mgnify:CR=1 FL=1